MSYPEQSPRQHSFDLKGILLTLLDGWKIVLVCVVVALMFAVYFLHNATYIYTAQMQVTPVNASSSTGGGGSSLGGLGSLGGLASVAMPSNQSGSQFNLYIDSLLSRDLAEDMAHNQSLLKRMFPGEWDEQNQRWVEPPESRLSGVKRWIRGVIGLPPSQPWTPPDAARMQGYLIDTLQIVQDARKPYLVTVVMSSTDPKFAVDFLNILNKTADNHRRQKALARARNYMDYLTAKLATVTVAEHREAIAVSLNEQEKYAMTANSGAPFAAELFDAPWANPLVASPVPRQVVLLAIVLGLLVGGALAFLFAYYGAVLRRFLPDFIRRRLV